MKTNIYKRLGVLAVISMVTLVAAEIGCRSFWLLRSGVQFFRQDRIIYSFYPELQSVDSHLPAKDDNYFDILVLGGSVLNAYWSDVIHNLQERLSEHAPQTVRVFNLAMPAHTSRDSLLKYRALHDSRFDMALVYHGMNDTRVNNIPPHLYKDNYDHITWYETANELSRNHQESMWSLPITVHFLYITIMQKINGPKYIPREVPFQEWTRYGHDLRSPSSFSSNVDELLHIAKSRGDQVLLLTFAYHVPKEYSYRLFMEKQLGYAAHTTPIELWGEREHVELAIAAQNEMLRKVSAEHPETAFLDMDRVMPKEGRLFKDPCHLSAEGADMFAGILEDFILNTR